LLDLLANPTALAIACAVLGLLVGSFLNVVILRLPPRLYARWREQAEEVMSQDLAADEAEDRPSPTLGDHQKSVELDAGQRADAAAKSRPPDLVFSRSHCPHCKHRLAPWENVPLLSFLALRGRCRHCGKPISWQYPAVEAITALAFAACALELGLGWQLLAALAFSAFLIAGSGIDLRTQLLPDELTLPLLWLGLLCSVAGWFVAPAEAIVGAALGYLALWGVYWTFKLLTGREGMGYGDFKLLAALGAFTGYAGLLPIILISSIAGAVLGTAWLLLRGSGRATPIPYGPFLAIAGFVQFLWGDALLGSILANAGG